MKKGYNTTMAMYDKIFSDPVIRTTMSDQISRSGNNILRYPDGMETLVEGRKFKRSEVLEFISFCEDSGVEQVILRADFNDIAGSLMAYGELSERLDVLYVECSNEPWFAPMNNPTNGHERRLQFLQQIFGRFGYVEFDRLKANQYADKCRWMRQEFLDTVHLEIVDKITFTIPVPIAKTWNVWLDVAKQKLADFPVVCFHLYGTDDPSKTDRMSDAIRKKVGNRWRKIATEWNGLHFGKHGWTDYAEQAFKQPHRNGCERMLGLMESNGFEYAGFHSWFTTDERRLFPRYIVNPSTGQLTDRMNGWF